MLNFIFTYRKQCCVPSVFFLFVVYKKPALTRQIRNLVIFLSLHLQHFTTFLTGLLQLFFSIIVVYCYLFSFSTLGNLIELMDSVKEKIANLERNTIMVSAVAGLQINRTIQNVQLGEVVNRIFKCLVCFSLARSPVCIGNCCKQVLGCGNCLQQWFVNNTSCPHCRADIGIEDTNNLVTCAFDELLDRCRVLLDNQSRIGFRSIFNFLLDPPFVNLGLSV